MQSTSKSQNKNISSPIINLPFQGHGEPDVLEFFSADRQKESVTYSLTGLPTRTAALTTADHRRAFDLYRHNRAWDDNTRLK